MIEFLNILYLFSVGAIITIFVPIMQEAYKMVRSESVAKWHHHLKVMIFILVWCVVLSLSCHVLCKLISISWDITLFIVEYFYTKINEVNTDLSSKINLLHSKGKSVSYIVCNTFIGFICKYEIIFAMLSIFFFWAHVFGPGVGNIIKLFLYGLKQDITKITPCKDLFEGLHIKIRSWSPWVLWLIILIIGYYYDMHFNTKLGCMLGKSITYGMLYMSLLTVYSLYILSKSGNIIYGYICILCKLPFIKHLYSSSVISKVKGESPFTFLKKGEINVTKKFSSANLRVLKFAKGLGSFARLLPTLLVRLIGIFIIYLFVCYIVLLQINYGNHHEYASDTVSFMKIMNDIIYPERSIKIGHMQKYFHTIIDCVRQTPNSMELKRIDPYIGNIIYSILDIFSSKPEPVFEKNFSDIYHILIPRKLLWMVWGSEDLKLITFVRPSESDWTTFIQSINFKLKIYGLEININFGSIVLKLWNFILRLK